MGKWDCRTCPVGHTSDFDRQRDSRCWGCGNYEQPPAERLGLTRPAHRLPPWGTGHKPGMRSGAGPTTRNKETLRAIMEAEDRRGAYRRGEISYDEMSMPGVMAALRADEAAEAGDWGGGGAD